MTETRDRGMDRAEIDRQLNLRERHPDHPAFFERWARDSAAVRDRLGGHLDLAYGESAGETLDLFVPDTGAGPVPLLAFIHGGYWQFLDKGDFSFLAPPFLDEGIAFASLNYDLAPAVTIPEIVAQIRRAVLWLARTGPDYGVDPAQIVVSGHSAGGHLTAMMSVTDWAAAAPDLPGSPVKAACPVSGIYELEPIRLSYHQDTVRLDPDAVAAMSPLRHVPQSAGPIVCAVGAEESDVFLDQQDAFVAACRQRGLDARVVDLPGRHHFSAIDALGEPDHPLFAAARDLARG